MKKVILLLCALCAFTVEAQTIADLKPKFQAAKSDGAKWAVVENWAAQQVAAADASKAAAVSVVQAKLDAALATNAVVVASLQAAGENHDALKAARAKAITSSLEKKRAALLAEIVRKQSELKALR